MRKLIWLLRRKQREAELVEELQFHVGEESGDRREIGNLGLIAEDTRAAWGWMWLEQLAQDLRYALRAMRASPGFTALAALSLALGIGANTAIYSLMDALVMRQLPVREPGRLAVLNWHRKPRSIRNSVINGISGSVYGDPKYGSAARIFPYPAFEMFRKSNHVFSALFAYGPARGLNLVIENQAELDSGQYVSGDYFRGLEVQPAAGRWITRDDDRAGAPNVVVLGYAASERRFGDAARAAGARILINNVPFTVAGVAPPGFFGTDPAIASQFFLPLHANLVVDLHRRFNASAARYLDAHEYWIEMMGRLRPGATMAQAQAELEPMFHRWVESTASTDEERRDLPEFHLTTGSTGIDTLRRRYSEPLYLLLAMVGLILAIACANIANLLLARATARRREMAVRLSIGAGRWRVMRQMLTESVVLASIGGALGVLLAIWGTRVLTALLAQGRNDLHAELNWRVLALAAALSIATGLLFGMAPALQATRVDVMPALKGARVSTRRRLRVNLSHALVVAQIAITMVLLVGAGLFVRTLSNLESIEMGFRRERILLFKVNAAQAGHRDAEMISFYRDLDQRFARIPGVLGVAESNSPLVGEGTWGSPAFPVGKMPRSESNGHYSSGAPGDSTFVLTATPGFFDTMGIPVIAGRAFDDRDRMGSPPVAMVNEEWASENFEHENPVGQRIVMELARAGKTVLQEMEVVGVAKNARYGNDLTGKFPAVVYMAFAQNLYFPPEDTTFTLRTAADPLTLVSAVREIVHQADARVPVTAVKTQTGMIQEFMGSEIMFARLATAFAILGLAIACVGLYGTMAYMVARRTGEIGIRMALGARAGRVMGMVLGQGIAMAAVGLGAGLIAALELSRVVESMLYGVKRNDGWSIAIAAGVMLSSVILAAYGPARRAARIDPVVALRSE
jgi:macrolide transport system ATP-binding/permease protein